MSGTDTTRERTPLGVRETSSGHIAFAGRWEFFSFGELQDVYRAPIACPLTPSGIRNGARWEGSFSWWNRYGEATLNALGRV